mmetsp:Transcript_29544/g.62801  ORF Transcript_29544/g.62801 Transcript_29544/m.62801 type:complete len:94 (+) Transcript_29544:143-424(+)
MQLLSSSSRSHSSLADYANQALGRATTDQRNKKRADELERQLRETNMHLQKLSQLHQQQQQQQQQLRFDAEQQQQQRLTFLQQQPMDTVLWAH